MLDYYKLLNVSRKCSDEELKISYKKLAMQFHPDKNLDDINTELIFSNIAIAYNTLIDHDKRVEYDNKTSFTNNFNKYSSIFGKSNTVSNFKKSPIRKSIKGEHIYHDIFISTSELYQQKKHCLDIIRNIKCGYCDGTGIQTLKKCHKCINKINNECKTCFGSGLEPDLLCDKCNSGLVQCKTTIEIVVPLDIKFGEKYIMAEKGHSGKNGGSSGDFIVTVYEKPDENNRIKRIDNRIHYLLDVTITDLVLGNDIKVDLFDKEFIVHISKGTQILENIVINDIIFDLNLIIPTNITDEEMILYEKLKGFEFKLF